MKRSEALEKLSVLISNSGHIEVPSSRYYDADALAEEILQFIEGIGMLPPEAKVPIGDFEAFLKNYQYNQDKNVYDELYKEGMLVLKNKGEPEA